MGDRSCRHNQSVTTSFRNDQEESSSRNGRPHVNSRISWLSICRICALSQYHTPFRFKSSTRSKFPELISTIGFTSPEMPAALKQTSILPNSFTVIAIAFSISASLEQSAPAESTRPVAEIDFREATVSNRCAAVWSTSAKFWTPSDFRRSATALPIPEAAPVSGELEVLESKRIGTGDTCNESNA